MERNRHPSCRLGCPSSVLWLTSPTPSPRTSAMPTVTFFPPQSRSCPASKRSSPTCPAWPTRLPRANLYCETGMLAHPLASPAAADAWTGACPLWLGSGQEQIVDASRLVAWEVHRVGGVYHPPGVREHASHFFLCVPDDPTDKANPGRIGPVDRTIWAGGATALECTVHPCAGSDGGTASSGGSSVIQGGTGTGVDVD
ncbi:hypothetical protein BDV41DRAFT_232299 [Aspergillus transmontanensis]|uniref:Uncharacterized protein n=1 Tax=Aspergillus transmontanensis TaxID=1034304 RepID=A0A5N6WHN8_9EURO|nr:hypothetical protein BDV41DRAFT_232299 [Aspergillus transmontanensis]